MKSLTILQTNELINIFLSKDESKVFRKFKTIKRQVEWISSRIYSKILIRNYFRDNKNLLLNLNQIEILNNEARELSNKLYPINKALFCEANPIPIKAAMYIAGLVDSLEYRLPLTPPSKDTMKFLEEIMKNYDIV